MSLLSQDLAMVMSCFWTLDNIHSAKGMLQTVALASMQDKHETQFTKKTSSSYLQHSWLEDSCLMTSL